MNHSDKALELKQKFGVATMFSSDNNGYTLSEEMATKMAIIAVDEILNTLDNGDIIYGSEYRYEVSKYWQEVKNELTIWTN